jgi:hypothetical protein
VLGLNPADVQRALAGAGRGAGEAAGQDTAGPRDGETGGQRGGGNGQASLGAATADSARGAAGGGTTGRAAGGTRPPAAEGLFGGRYIVFVMRPEGPVPVWIRTGLTDLDYSEVREGVGPADSVLILPSASLVQSQQESQERINRITGGGGVPGMRQQPAPGSR